MSLISFLPVLAGMGMFLYGMSLMGSSLEKLAGSRMESTLERLTTNRFMGVLLGTVVTGLIQSSAATTVMVVGFVNAGLMKLAQAVSVIMGANIGTTVTAQIIRLSELSGGNSSFLSFFKPSAFSPILIVAGAFLVLFFRGKRTKDIGTLLFGFGILFFGMYIMETTLAPLKDSPLLATAFTRFENPIMGLVAGAVVTALIQSSSASVGLLQALSTTGAVSFAMMVPIILGQNIGTCITVLLSSIGANKNAKRAAMIHLYFNIIGTIIFFVGIYGFNAIWGIKSFENPVNMGAIANFHTIFNVVNTIILLPFCGLLVKLSKITIRGKKNESAEEDNLLDERFLATPSIAIEQSRKLILKMGHTAAENVRMASGLMKNYDRRVMAALEENERFCDKTESKLSEYLIKVTSKPLTDRDSQLASEMFHTLSDFERISDRATNIAEVALYNSENGIAFSQDGVREIKILSQAVEEILSDTLAAYTSLDKTAAYHIEPLEEIIDIVTEALKNRHVERLLAGTCSIQAGISFLELLTNYERIADHCSNIAIYIIQLSSPDRTFDPHEHVRMMHDGLSEEYKNFYAHYEERFYKPIVESPIGTKKNPAQPNSQY